MKCAEYIEYMQAYRVFDSENPSSTIAYESDTEVLRSKEIHFS